MPRYLPIKTIRVMPYAELERWWETDFDVLASTAIAEATGPVHPTVSKALHSSDWIEEWADALHAGAGTLASSVERMAFTNDHRLEREKGRERLVLDRVEQATQSLRTHQAGKAKGTASLVVKDAYWASLSILAGHYHEEVPQLPDANATASGPPDGHERQGVVGGSIFDTIEEAVSRGVLIAPVSPAVNSLLTVPVRVMTSKVSTDAKQQQDRCNALRHPLVLRRWSETLRYLIGRQSALLGFAPTSPLSLPPLDVRSLHAMRVEQAWSVINGRRYLRALAQRSRECGLREQQLGRVAVEGPHPDSEPWPDATAKGWECLGRRYSAQLAALMAGFAPFCEPGTTKIKQDALAGPTRRELVRILRTALANGRWAALAQN